jgi:uncharacterized cupredoxin-like copper-binding protein
VTLRQRLSCGLAPAGLLVLALSGCGGAAQTRQTVVRVTERDFRITAPHRAKAGDLVLSVRNRGPDAHELIVVRERGARLPLRADGSTVSEEKLEPITVGTLEPGHPGSVRKLRLHLTPGRYELFCNMSGHYLGGMHKTLVVG